MLDISRAERHLIFTFLILGSIFLFFSYCQKTTSSYSVGTIVVQEPQILIDINRANAEELERLPGIGPVLAQDIVAYRERLGVFKRIEELKDIKGIGDKKFEKIKDLISIGE